MKKQLFFNLCLVMVLVLTAVCGLAMARPQMDNSAVSGTDGVKSTYVSALNLVNADAVTGAMNTLATEAQRNDNEKVSAIVELKGANGLVKEFLNSNSASVAYYATTAEGKAHLAEIDRIQNEFMALVAEMGIVAEYSFSYNMLNNGLAVSMTWGDLKKVEALDMVKNVTMDVKYEASKAEVKLADLMDPSTGIFANNTNYQGEGMLIAIVDTGLDINHEAFSVMPVNPALDVEDVDAVANLLSFNRNGRWTGADLYKNEKVGFGFDYADGDAGVIFGEQNLAALSGYHGTHVAGIAAGNNGDDFFGAAPEAQLAVMKLMGDMGSGMTLSLIAAAVSDTMVLGADVVNLSLGMPMGSAEELNSANKFVSDLYATVDAAGVSVIASAGNSYNTGLRSNTGANLPENPDLGTIGAPGSYLSSLCVASLDAEGKVHLVSGDGEAFYWTETVNAANYYMDFLGDFFNNNEDGVYEYVVVPNFGVEADYEGIDAEGKIVLCYRGGGIAFTDKAKAAKAHGAIACMIINNEAGTINAQITESVGIPTCTLDMELGARLAASANKTIEINRKNVTGPYMSDFSSWGPLTDLTMKPEITGFGGMIYSSVPHAYASSGYASMSGTSMSSPNVAGAMAIVRQYIEESGLALRNKDIQNLGYMLAMSTAATVVDDNGNPVSVRKQGAGLMNIDAIVNTKAYLSVTGSNRAKLELMDDPSEAGIYNLMFNVNNMSEEELTYNVNVLTFTESLAQNGVNVAYLAHMLDTTVVTYVNGEEVDGTVVVPAYESVRVKIVVTLTEEAKDYIRATFANGYYVEGFAKLEQVSDEAIDLSIPFLSFFGDFTKAPIFEPSVYDSVEAQANAHFGVVTPYLNYADQYILPAGVFPYSDIAAGYEAPVANMENAAFSAYTTTTNGIYGIYMYTLRTLSHVELIIKDSITGDVIIESRGEDIRKTYYNVNNGEVAFTTVGLGVNIINFGLYNNQELIVEVVAHLDFWRDAVETFTFKAYVDFETPEYVSAKTWEENGRKGIDVTLYDNHKIMAYQLNTVDEATNSLGKLLVDGVIPTNDWVEGTNNTVRVDLTDILDDIKASGSTRLGFRVDDWALNAAAWGFDVSAILGSDETGSKEVEEEVVVNADNEEIFEVVDANGTHKFTVTTMVWKEQFAAELPGLWNTERRVLTKYEGPAGDVYIPEEADIEIIAGAVFRNVVGLTGLDIPEGVYFPGRFLFYGNATVEWVNFPSTTVYIAENAFHTSGVKEVTIPRNVVGLGTGFFQSSIAIEKLIFEDGCPNWGGSYEIDGERFSYNGTGSDFGGFFAYYASNLREIVNMPQITGFGYGAFRNATSLRSITIPASLKSVSGSQAFHNASSLQSVVMESATPITVAANFLTWSAGYNAPYRTVYVPAGSAEAYKAHASWNNAGAGGTTSANYSQWIRDISEWTIDEDGVATEYKGNDANVVVPNGVTALGKYVFDGNTTIKSIFLPGTVTEIGDGAFVDATLESIYINEELTTIGENAFSGSALVSVTLPAGIEAIGAGAFYNCESLKTINVEGRTPAKLGKGAFDGIPADAQIVIPEQTTEVYAEAWAAYKAMFVEVFPYVVSGTTILSYSGIGGDLVLPEGYTVVGTGAFAGKTNITSLVIPEGYTTLSDDAFNGCYNMVKVVMPDSLTTFTGEATMTGGAQFMNCSNLAEVVWSKNLTFLPCYSFQNCDLSKSTLEGANIEVIGAFAFAGTNLGGGTLVVPETVVEMYDYCFSEARMEHVIGYANAPRWAQAWMKPYSLKTFTWYGDVGSIEGYDFSEGDLVEWIEFHGRVESISNFTFINMDSLTRVEFFGDVGGIGGLSFHGLPVLSEVIFHGDLGFLNYDPYLSASADYLYTGAFVHNVPMLKSFTIAEDNEYLMADEYGLMYKKSLEYMFMPLPTWDYEGTIVLPEGLKRIPDYTFFGPSHGCPNFEYGTSGGWSATAGPGDANHAGVTGIVIPASVEFIGERALSYDGNWGGYKKGLANLETITFATEGKQAAELTIGAMAFQNTAISSLDLPSNVKELGTYAFYNVKITNLVLPEGFEKLNAFTFGNNKNLESVTVPSTMLPDNFTSAFIGCDNLKTWNISENNPYFNIVDDILYNADKTVIYGYFGTATELRIADGVKYISANAFNGNTTLKKVTLPASLEAIGHQAFYQSAIKDYVFLGTKAPKLYAALNTSWVGTHNHMYVNFNEAIMNMDYYEQNNALVINLYAQEGSDFFNNYVWGTYFTNMYVVDENGEVVEGKANVNDVNNMINNLPENATLADKALVESILVSLEMMDAQQLAQINGLEKVEDAQAAIEAIENEMLMNEVALANGSVVGYALAVVALMGMAVVVLRKVLVK